MAVGGTAIKSISFKRHRFPREVICYAVWLYFRFTLSIRDVEELLAQRGIAGAVEGENLRGHVILRDHGSWPLVTPY